MAKNVQFPIIIAFQKNRAKKCGNCTSCCRVMREMYGKTRAVQAEKRSFPLNHCTNYLSCRKMREMNDFSQLSIENIGEMHGFSLCPIVGESI